LQICSVENISYSVGLPLYGKARVALGNTCITN